MLTLEDLPLLFIEELQQFKSILQKNNVAPPKLAATAHKIQGACCYFKVPKLTKLLKQLTHFLSQGLAHAKAGQKIVLEIENICKKQREL